MIVFAYATTDKKTNVAVLFDPLSTDDTFTKTEISTYVKQLTKNPETVKFYPLSYSYTYTHTGRQLGQALKTRLVVNVVNPPIELVRMTNVSVFTSRDNVASIADSTRVVADPQIRFPSALLVQKFSGGILTRRAVITSANYNSTQRRTYHMLKLTGASYDTAVMRLKFAFNIVKTKPLFDQLSAQSDIKITFDDAIKTMLPKVSRYYAPATAQDIFDAIAIDNNLTYDMTEAGAKFFSLDPKNAPPEKLTEQFCFRARAKQARLVQEFSFENYTNAKWTSEIYDARLFSSVVVWNDTGNDDDEKTTFSNLVKTVQKPAMVGFQLPVSGYRFWVMEYELQRSDSQLYCVTTAANNWIMANLKLDALLEQKVFLQK